MQPDPHFGIRFLLAVPSALQRRIAASRGFRDEQHFVDRIYISIRGIRRLFPGFAVAAVLSRSRAPRQLFWDAVVLKKV